MGPVTVVIAVVVAAAAGLAADVAAGVAAGVAADVVAGMAAGVAAGAVTVIPLPPVVKVRQASAIRCGSPLYKSSALKVISTNPSINGQH